jgi:O-antigen/teichoic acid export membrane protein
MHDLKKKATSALAWDFLGTLSHQGVGFIISIFLARLLEPSEFGVIAMAMVFITISQVFADFGFASALIQNKNNSSVTYSSIFYINIVSGILLCCLFQLLAPVIGEFYNDETITVLVRWLSLSFVFSSFNIVQQTILRRNIDFKTLTIRGIISQVLGGVAGVICAFNGWGVYSLVVQNLSAAFINTVILWRVAEWHPTLEFSWREVKSLTKFSTYVFLGQSFNQLINKLDVIIVGKVFSPATLGFYGRAVSLNSLVTKYSSTSLLKVFFPVLSKVQDDEERFRSILFRLLHLSSFISFLFTGIMILAGEDIIILLFGQKWQDSVFIFQVLALKAFAYSNGAIIVNAFLAKGKSKENFWYGNLRRVIAFSAFPFAIWYGFEAFLWAVVGTVYLNWFINNFLATRSLGISFFKQAATVLPYLSIFIGSYFFIRWLVSFWAFPFSGLIAALLYGGMFILICYIIKLTGLTYLRSSILEIWQQRSKRLLKRS